MRLPRPCRLRMERVSAFACQLGIGEALSAHLAHDQIGLRGTYVAVEPFHLDRYEAICVIQRIVLRSPVGHKLGSRQCRP